MDKALIVAKFLYANDGNRNLPKQRVWGELAPYWRERYLQNARELLTLIEE